MLTGWFTDSDGNPAGHMIAFADTSYEDSLRNGVMKYGGMACGAIWLGFFGLSYFFSRGFHSEDIRRVYQGIFVKQKVLFEGEIMEYRIYDYLDGHRRLAAEGQVECDHKLEGKENSRFACLNEMGAAIKDRDDSRLLNAMEDYLKKSAALGRLFPME